MQGITAKELCYYFWNNETRHEWEDKIENTEIVETVDENTTVSYTLCVRVRFFYLVNTSLGLCVGLNQPRRYLYISIAWLCSA